MNELPIESLGARPTLDSLAVGPAVDAARSADFQRAFFDRGDALPDRPGLDLSLDGLDHLERFSPRTSEAPLATEAAADADGAAQRGDADADAALRQRAEALPDDLDGLVREVLALITEKDVDPRLMLFVQLKVQRATFALESVSKTIEHGMASAKNLMQTQV